MSTPTLQQHYKDKVVPALKKKLGYTNLHQVPRLEKIVVTSCMGKAPDRKVAVDDAVDRDPQDHRPEARPSPTRRRPSPTSSCARVKSSVPASPCAAPACGNSCTASSTSPRRTSATSAASPRSPSTAAATTPAASRTSRSSRKSKSTRSSATIGFDLIFVTSAPTDAEGRALLAELGMPFRDMKKANEAEEAAAV